MCNLPCPAAASRVLVRERVCACPACPWHTPCLPGPGAGMSQAAAVSHIFHPSRRRRWAGSVPAWVGLGEAVGGGGGTGDPRILLPRHGWMGIPCQRVPSLHPRGAVAGEIGEGEQRDPSCRFLPAGMQRSWWGGVCPQSGRARSPQEGIAARLLQAPGHVQGRALQPHARCISGAELAPAPWAILRWRAAGGLSTGGARLR